MENRVLNLFGDVLRGASIEDVDAIPSDHIVRWDGGDRWTHAIYVGWLDGANSVVRFSPGTANGVETMRLKDFITSKYEETPYLVVEYPSSFPQVGATRDRALSIAEDAKTSPYVFDSPADPADPATLAVFCRTGKYSRVLGKQVGDMLAVYIV